MYPFDYYTPLAPPTMKSVLVDQPDPVLTLPQAKLRAGLDWADGDARDELMQDHVAAATHRVQVDTDLALMTQTRDVLIYGALPTTICLPAQSRPLQEVTSITYVDAAGNPATVDPSTYAVDLNSARITALSAWPTNSDPFGLWTVRIIAGYADSSQLPPLLLQAVGILTAHLATSGRDLLALPDQVTEMPYGYDDCIAQYRSVRAA